MAEERVVLTAELKDQMSAPLETATKKVEGFTRTVETGAKKQAAATERSTAQITGAVGKQNRLFGGMTSVVGRATTGTSRLFRNMSSSVTRDLDGIAGKATKAGERAGSGFAGGMRKMIGPVAGLVGAGVFAGFIAEAGRASDATDKFKSTMSFAGLDTSAITKATADAKAYADQTVYDLPTIQNTFAQLASNGVKNYTDITKAAGNLNAVAGGNAETFKSVSRTLTQSAGAGKLMTEDWNMLADAIPGAAGPLMKALKDAGAYTGNFRDAMADGQITSEEFQTALLKLGTKPVAVEAAKSTKTFEGALGNLNATINSKLMVALDKIKPAATEAIGALTDGLGKALDWTGKAAQGLYDLFVKGDFGAAFREAFNVQEDSPLVDAMFNIRDAAAKLPDAAKALWDMREPIGIVAGLILALLIPHWVRLGTEALVSAGKQKLAWVMTQNAAIQSTYKQLWGFAVISAGWVAMAAVATAQAAIAAGKWLVALGPVGWIIIAIGLLVAAFVWAYNNIGWFRDGVDAAMKWVGDAVKVATDWIVGAWNNVVDWWNATLMPAIDAVGKWFGDMFTNVGNWARDFIGFFVDGWGMLVDFFNGVLMPAVQAVGAFFAPIFDWIGRLVWNFATIAVALFYKLVDFWNGVLLPALQSLGDFFGTVLNWIYTTIIKPYIDLWVGAFNGIIDFWNGVLVPGAQALGNWFMSILNWIYTSIIQPVIDLIVGAFRGIVDFWNGVLVPAFQAVGNWFMSILDWIYNTIIKPYMDLLIGAFGMLTDFWNNTLKPVIDTVGGWFSDIIGGAINSVKDWIDDLVKGFQIMMTFIGDKLQPVIDGIRGTFEDLGKIIGDVLGKIGEFMNNPLGGIQDILGIKKDGNGQGIMPSNSGGGVYAGNGVRFAGGGVLGGYSPGNDSILARLSPGESVLVPELTRAIGPQTIMAANAAASGGRKAGSGPSLTSGHSRAGRGGGSTLTVHAPVQITVQGGADGVDYAALKGAVNDAFEELIASHNRRAY
jgi:tape measure domain-containing protein